MEELKIELEVKKEIEYCKYEDFKKLDIRVGEIIRAELAPKSEKLVVCTVDFGELGSRTIVSGINNYIDSIDGIIGKKVLYLFNLEPKSLMGIESQGMLLAIGDSKENFSFMIPDMNVLNGSRIN